MQDSYSKDVEGENKIVQEWSSRVQNWKVVVKVLLGWIQELWAAQILAFITLREDTLLTNVNIAQELSWHLEGRCDCLHRCCQMIESDRKRKVKRWKIMERGNALARKSVSTLWNVRGFLQSFRFDVSCLRWAQSRKLHSGRVKSMRTLESLTSEKLVGVRFLAYLESCSQNKFGIVG